MHETSVYREPCFESKMKREIKLNSEHLLELATLGIYATWRM